MPEYHKIQTVFKRDDKGKIIRGDWTLPEFEYLSMNQWQLTEKVNGTNIRVEWDGRITFGGKTDRAQIPEQLLKRLEERFYPRLPQMEQIFPTPATLYFEGYGPKIQSGGKYRNDQDIVLFDIKVGDWWLRRQDLEDVAGRLDLPIVPIVHTYDGTLMDAISLVAHGFKSKWGNVQAEGVVAKPVAELRTRGGDRIIAKIKTKDFK